MRSPCVGENIHYRLRRNLYCAVHAGANELKQNIHAFKLVFNFTRPSTKKSQQNDNKQVYLIFNLMSPKIKTCIILQKLLTFETTFFTLFSDFNLILNSQSFCESVTASKLVIYLSNYFFVATTLQKTQTVKAEIRIFRFLLVQKITRTNTVARYVF